MGFRNKRIKNIDKYVVEILSKSKIFHLPNQKFIYFNIIFFSLTPTSGHRQYNTIVREKNRPHSPVRRPHSPINRPHSPIHRPHSPAFRSHSPTNKVSIYSPVPYQRQSVNDIKERFGSQIHVTPMEQNAAYKKRPAPKAPDSINDCEPKPHRKGPAPQPIKPWESKPGVEYTYERSNSPSTLNPIKELERIGRKNDVEVIIVINWMNFRLLRMFFMQV